MEFSSYDAEINGIKIHYRLYGGGEPLLLIMGLGGNADWWDEEFLRLLAERFQVITFDNRGAGRSGRPEGPYTIAQMAADTVGLMDHLGLPSAHVLGFSMGGMIAQELACTYPERVKRLILISTFCGGEEAVQASPEVKLMMSLPRDGVSEETLATGTIHLIFPQDYVESNPSKMEEVIAAIKAAPIEPRCYFAQLEAADNWSIYPRLRDLRQPTLIIAGGRDVIIPPENSRILEKAIPNSRLEEFPEAGHQITSMYPEKVARLVLEFLT